ncbi:uncharacterized protein LOC131218730 isoform X2 [Magnolia sinica]|uniref:uncharacterized protein LOC131218730 isoform X2 n=1 Tax=Magnolia sinica TaxID=86752 RepID=UPI0026585738|nr:uncharacterized protein LOC131218730 isoform X2 [Magnolia sinica]
MENHANRGRATGSRGRGRHRSENPHQNPNFWQNRQSPATHVQNSGRGRLFRDPATPHSAAPRGYGGDGGRGSGGRGRGGRGGAQYVARRPNSESAATTASAATMDASRQARRPNINSFPTSSASSGSSSTSVTHFPGAQNQHHRSHHRWRMLPEVCRLLYVLATFIGILFLVINGRFNEIASFLEVVAVLKNLMLSG